MKFSVIVATLLRPSLQDLLSSLREQTLPQREWELLTWTGCSNEYEARNEAAKQARGDCLAFTDDDCIVSSDWLEKADSFLRISQNKNVVCFCGPLEGDFYGWGQKIRLAKPGWYVGANFFVKKSAFDTIGGFEANWGLSPHPKGWRGDSDLGFRLEDKFGKENCEFAKDVLVYHPKSMQSQWVPEVEREFYLRHREKCLTRFTPVDPRLSQFIAQNDFEKDPLVLEYVRNDQKVRADFARLAAISPVLDIGSKDGWTFHKTEFEHTNFDLDRYRDSIQGDGMMLPFADRSFATVMLGEILEHVKEPYKLLHEALRVAKSRVLLTIPAEHEWQKEKAPLLTREERMKQDGFKDLDAMQRYFTGSNVQLVETVLESKFPHTWHVNWFDASSLDKLFSEFNPIIKQPQIQKISQSGYVWFACRIDKKETRF